MKKLLLIISICIAGNVSAQSPLDISFGNNGTALFPGFPSSHCVDGSLQHDGKLLNFYFNSVGGTNHGFYIFRLWPNGTLDTSFSSNLPVPLPGTMNGIKYIAVGGCGDGGLIRERSSDHGIILGVDGYTILKFKPNGETDTSYGNGAGAISLNQSPSTPLLLYLRDFYEDASGANYYLSTTVNHDTVLVAKTLANGNMDNTYGTNGIKSFVLPAVLGNTSQVLQVMFKTNGQVLAVGNKFGSPATHGFICQYNLNGTIDNSFGTNGIYLDASGFSESYTTITQSQNGDLYLGGLTHNPDDFFTVKMSSTGVIDNTFGTGGKKSYPYPSSPNNVPYIITPPHIISGSPIYIAASYYTGSAIPQANSQSYHSITGTGINNASFSTNGTWNTTVNYRVEKMVSQPDGKVICFGTDSIHTRILRYGNGSKSGIGQVSLPAFSLYQSDKNVYLTSPEGIQNDAYQLYLYSANGQLVKKYSSSELQNNGNRIQIALPDALPPGIYILNAAGKNYMQSLKVVL